jgi:cytochrome c-type biogenesis protein
MEVSFGLSFLAGLASFLTPCVISLVPAYVGYLTGRTASNTLKQDQVSRWNALLHGLAFVVGFSIVFILLGLAFSAIGNLLYSLRDWLAKIGGVVVILFGLHMTGILKIPFLEYDLRPRSSLDRNRGYFSSLLLGIFFSAGWSPCVGPVLGTILLFALNEGSLSSGFFLLLAYSLGMALPFLFAALAIGWVTRAIRRYRKVIRYIEIVMGAIMILVGIMLFLGTFSTLARFGSIIDLGL